MALVPMERPRALGLLRHAVAAAGLGLGWLLLSGPAASALGDPLGAESLPGFPASAVSQLEPAAAVQSTTTALAGTVGTAPSVAEPLLAGPLQPLAPVASGATSGVGEAITTAGETAGSAVDSAVGTVDDAVGTVGDAVGTVVDTVGALVPLPLPVAPSGPVLPPLPDLPGPQPGVPAAPPAAGSGPAIDVPPALDVTPVVGAASPGTVAPAADSLAATSGAVRAWDWSMPAYAATVLAEVRSAAEPPPTGPPGDPSAFPLLDRQLWLGSGSAGPSGGGFTGSAMLAAALMLPALLLLTVRKRPYAGPAPASPAFDPGSTPD